MEVLYHIVKRFVAPPLLTPLLIQKLEMIMEDFK